MQSPLFIVEHLLCNHQEPGQEKRKRPVQKTAFIHFDGAESDTGDREQYDDADKALLHYAFDHYAYWKSYLGLPHPRLEQPGAFSENISTQGITERDLCIGDIFQAGGAVIQVTQGREACGTMNRRFNHPEMNLEMHSTHRNGWFYRVLTEGQIATGDAVQLLERPNPQWTLARVQQYVFNPTQDTAILEELASLPYMAKEWTERFLKQLNG